AELLQVRADVARARVAVAGRGILLHLVRADVDGLNVLPLEAPPRAVRRPVLLFRADAVNGAAGRPAAERPVARGSRFLVVDAEVGLLGAGSAVAPSRPH